MTSLVAILNNQAVALAADSAVTTAGPSGQKIYNTVNKLFTLSKHHPVGIMVYSSAEIMGVPIETAIKAYRETRGNASCDSLEGYSDHFLSFLKTDSIVFSDEARSQHCESVISASLYGLYDRILRYLNGQYSGWGHPTQSEARQAATLLLEEQVTRFQNSSLIAGSDDNIKRKLKKKLKSLVNAWKDKFREAFDLRNTTLALLTDHCLDLLLREQSTDVETGFVIAGFGEKEYLPQLRNFEFEASVEGVHKFAIKQSRDVSKQGATIVPFAQREMVDTFMQGYSVNLDGFLRYTVDQFFEEKKQDAQNNSAPSADIAQIISNLDGLRNELRPRLVHEMRAFANTEYVRPVLETLTGMPKEELALLAEALVNLQIIKRHASPDADTVGGPTDVAVISKGDGFIWIKRKHYFRPELNPHFSRNYFREVSP